MVKCGKLAAWLLVPQDSLEGVVSLAEEYEVQCTTEPSEIGWYGVWIWEKPLAGELIRALPTVRDRLPTTVYHWYMGSLFSYSAEAIETFLREFGNEGPRDAGLVAVATRG